MRSFPSEPRRGARSCCHWTRSQARSSARIGRCTPARPAAATCRESPSQPQTAGEFASVAYGRQKRYRTCRNSVSGEVGHMPRTMLLLAAAGALLALPLAAQTDPAASYPGRSIRVVVTVPAGGGVDSVTRIFADKLQRRLGQPFVIENQGGAGGNVGASTVFAAAPDGYTLMSSQPAPLTTNSALYKKLSFDPAAFEPVAIMSRFPNVLLVRKDFPAKTAAEFIAYAKANPGRLNFASQGIGTTSHLTTELFMSLTGTRMVHVPYKGTAPALNDLLAGQVDFIFMELSSAVKLHQGGNARILGVATDKRLESLPDIPTMIEAGVPNFVSDTWNALSAP